MKSDGYEVYRKELGADRKELGAFIVRIRGLYRKRLGAQEKTLPTARFAAGGS